MTATARAHQILKKLSAYEDLSIRPFAMPGLKLADGESVIGIYRNVPNSLEESILVTTAGLHIRRTNCWEQVLYRSISHMQTPDGKRDVLALNLEMADGSTISAPIKGVSAGRFYDSFEVLRFLDRVLSDIRSKEDR